MKKEPGSYQLDRNAKLVLAVALALVLMSVAQVAYRFTLPTDGWSVYSEEITEGYWRLDENLVGAQSALESSDALLAVDGISVKGASSSQIEPPGNWRAGRSVTMTVRRGEEELEVTVPVVKWTVAAAARYNLLDPEKFTAPAGALILLAVGWFTFLRRPEVPSARALLILSTALGAAFISGILPDGLSVQFDSTAFGLTLFFSYAIFGTLIAPSLLSFTLLFPRPKMAIQRRPWLALLPFAYGGLLLLFLLGGGPAEAGWVSTLAMFALSLASLIHAGFTQRDAVSRAQMRWTISSFVLGLGLFMLNFPVAFGLITYLPLITLIGVLQSLGFVVIGTGLAIAVLRYRLFDIDVIIRKTLLYAFLSALLALVYFGSVVLLQSLLGRAANEQSPLVIVVSTLFIAALFAPLRRRLQYLIDHRFFRLSYDREEVLARFARTAQEEVELEALTAELVSLLQDALQPESIAVWFGETSSPGDGR